MKTDNEIIDELYDKLKKISYYTTSPCNHCTDILSDNCESNCTDNQEYKELMRYVDSLYMD